MSDIGGVRVGVIAGVALLWAVGLCLFFVQVPDFDYSGTVPLGQDLTVHISEPGVETFVWIFRQHHDFPVFRDLRFEVTSPAGPVPVADPPHKVYRGMPDGKPFTVGDVAEFRVRQPGDYVVHVEPRGSLPDGTLALVPSPTVSHPLVPRAIALGFFAAAGAITTGCIAVAAWRRDSRRRVPVRSNTSEPDAFIRHSRDGIPSANTDIDAWQAPP